MITAHHVVLSANDDREAALLMLDGELAAVAVKLSHIHGHLQGRWFIDYTPKMAANTNLTFESLTEFKTYLERIT